jgi:hypothetical protein
MTLPIACVMGLPNLDLTAKLHRLPPRDFLPACPTCLDPGLPDVLLSESFQGQSWP